MVSSYSFGLIFWRVCLHWSWKWTLVFNFFPYILCCWFCMCACVWLPTSLYVNVYMVNNLKLIFSFFTFLIANLIKIKMAFMGFLPPFELLWLYKVQNALRYDEDVWKCKIAFVLVICSEKLILELLYMYKPIHIIENTLIQLSPNNLGNLKMRKKIKKNLASSLEYMKTKLCCHND